MINEATGKEAVHVQAGPLGEASLQFTVPQGLLLDDEGGSITDAALAPSDIITALVAITAATIDLTANHTNFTLNNMIACLVATDILQVGKLPCCFCMVYMVVSLQESNAWYPFGLYWEAPCFTSPSAIAADVPCKHAECWLL